MADVLGKTGVNALLLSDYLSRAGRKAFVWGDLDCFLFVADWVERMTGIDPAGEYRGAYDDQRQARNVIKRNGGVMQLADALLARAGCKVTDAPSCGDVALVRAGFRYRPRGRLASKIVFVPVGAICVRASMWAIKPADGAALAMGNFPIMRAWAVANG